MPRPGWIERQYRSALEDVKTWPKWMIREAGLQEVIAEKTETKKEQENA